MKSVLLSIKPKYCELIASGKKTIEVRKTRPKLETPFKCYIYCTKDKTPFLLPTYSEGNLTDNDIWKKGNGKVIGEFDCNIIEGGYLISPWGDFIQKETCLTYAEINEYAGDKPLCAWHISDLKIYDKPKELSEFRRIGALSYDNWLYGLYNGSETYEDYLARFGLTCPPQSWCYVEEYK